MFYKIIRPIARFIVWVLNGHLHVHHKDRIPKGNYILVAPHRTWWEPILFALAASPMEFMFMAKKELFKNPILRFILVHAHALVPVVYQGPLTFKGFLKRKSLDICFGDPIYIPRREKINKETTPALYQQLEEAWDKLDKEQNPDFHYIAK